MIGLFLGSTDFPKKVLDKIKKKKKKYFIIDLTITNSFKKNKNSYFISIGKFGKILKLIKEKKCKKVLFAGKIDKPKISTLKLDVKGIYYLPRIIKASKLGDAAILKELIKIFKKPGGILIKFPKKKQDLRADLPTIGLDTLKDCKKANLKGVVLKSNQNIFMDKVKCISFANKNKIFIKVI